MHPPFAPRTPAAARSPLSGAPRPAGRLTLRALLTCTLLGGALVSAALPAPAVAEAVASQPKPKPKPKRSTEEPRKKSRASHREDSEGEGRRKASGTRSRRSGETSERTESRSGRSGSRHAKKEEETRGSRSSRESSSRRGKKSSEREEEKPKSRSGRGESGSRRGESSSREREERGATRGKKRSAEESRSRRESDEGASRSRSHKGRTEESSTRAKGRHSESGERTRARRGEEESGSRSSARKESRSGREERRPVAAAEPSRTKKREMTTMEAFRARLASRSESGSRSRLMERVLSGPRLSYLSRMLIPVEGVDAQKLRDSYLEGRSGGRTHHAIDIHAPRGTPVLAAADGRILKLHNSLLGGITIYQLDDDGETRYYYAHLERYVDGLYEGQRVARGETIGYVGDSGNAQPGDTHLHFAVALLKDVRRWWDGSTLNPYALLTRGEREAEQP